MGENSAIEWTHHSQNYWVGCTKVSPACDHCYAESWAKRTGHPELWQGARRRTKTWNDPVKWNRAAMLAGRRDRVFSNSLSDFFDNQVPEEWRRDAWTVIRATPYLDHLLLTKRPQNIAKMLPDNWGDGWPNVWLGTTAENQEEHERRGFHLKKIPARVKFFSCEPMLGPIDLFNSNFIGDWYICGGESGGKKRPMNLDWAYELMFDCNNAKVPFFMKQIDGVKQIPDGLMQRQFPVSA